MASLADSSYRLAEILGHPTLGTTAALRDKQQWSGVLAAASESCPGEWAVPGSNGRALACKARAAAAVYRFQTAAQPLRTRPASWPRSANGCQAARVPRAYYAPGDRSRTLGRAS